MRHQPRHSAVAIHERMNPHQPMMGRGRRDDPIRLSEVAVRVFKAVKETGYGTGANGDVVSNLDIALAPLARHNANSLLACRVFDPKEILRQQFAESLMDFANALGFNRPAATHGPGR